MKERQILFSAPMVRAILAGTKTQTRRVVKPVKFYPDFGCAAGRVGGAWKYGSPAALGLRERGDNWSVILEGDVLQRMCTSEAYGWGASAGCPYGQPGGSSLWVRETFFAWGRWETRFSAKKGRDEWHFIDMTLECGKEYSYPATDSHPLPMRGKRDAGVLPGWWKRPAIFMPTAASRITLEITSVRVERLQDISEADAMAEGTPCYVCGGPLNGLSEDDCHCFHRRAQPSDYRGLWESINGPGSWDLNPWVWVVEFSKESS